MKNRENAKKKDKRVCMMMAGGEGVEAEEEEEEEKEVMGRSDPGAAESGRWDGRARGKFK